MRKERVQTISGQFTNEETNEVRFYTIAAISEVFGDCYKVCNCDDWDAEDKEVVKGVKLGISICNPIDIYNERLGKEIAIGRARKNSEYALYASKLGYVNSLLIDGLLRQEAEYLEKNPELFIANYKRKK